MLIIFGLVTLAVKANFSFFQISGPLWGYLRDGTYQTIGFTNSTSMISARFTSPKTCDVNQVTIDICSVWRQGAVTRIGIQADRMGYPDGQWLGYFDFSGPNYRSDLDSYYFLPAVHLVAGNVYHLLMQPRVDVYGVMTYYNPGHKIQAKDGYSDTNLALIYSFDNGRTWGALNVDPAVSVVTTDRSDAFPIPYIDPVSTPLYQMGNVYVGQRIVPSENVAVDYVEFALEVKGNPTGSVTASFVDENSDVYLDTRTFTSAGLPNPVGSYQVCPFTTWDFAKPIILEKNHAYTLRFNAKGGDSGNFYGFWYLFCYTDIGKEGTWQGSTTHWVQGILQDERSDLIYAFHVTAASTGNLDLTASYEGNAISSSVYLVGPEGTSAVVDVPINGYTWYSLSPGEYTIYGSSVYGSVVTQATVVANQITSVLLDFNSTPIQSQKADYTIYIAYGSVGLGTMLTSIGALTNRKKHF